jgi:p21-activated kinase 1
MEPSKGGRRLTKRNNHQGPPISYNNAASSNSTSLRRAPSDASYFNAAPQHTQGGLGLGLGAGAPSSAITGASPQLRRSPSLLTPVQEQKTQRSNYSYNYPIAAQFSHLPPASVGAPFNASSVEAALHASGSAGPRRPSPPQHAKTYTSEQPQPARFKAPTLRQSASFTALARKMDTPPSGTKSPRNNRYSDDGDAAKKRLSGGGKKKGTFSSFMSNLVSSPRRPTISTPTNPMHVTHVSIDNETGEFTVRGPPAHGVSAPSAACAGRRVCTLLRLCLCLCLYPSIARRPWFVFAR